MDKTPGGGCKSASELRKSGGRKSPGESQTEGWRPPLSLIYWTYRIFRDGVSVGVGVATAGVVNDTGATPPCFGNTGVGITVVDSVSITFNVPSVVGGGGTIS